ncbi:MAG: FliM/FliN family flagellar motor switch protein [Planctomycetaceae bacterium]|nr:FliM/FliN family flagellar motor switch protein [Planctomycetaceae bacterium]
MNPETPCQTSGGVRPQQLRRLQALYEGLTRGLQESLAILLRTDVELHVASVDLGAYGPFVDSVSSPACFFVLKVEPLGDPWILDIEPAVLHPMLDRLLGGNAIEPPPCRPLTEIEQGLAVRIIRLFLQECRSAWSGSLDLRFDVLSMETEPGLSRILPSDEMVVVVGWDVTVGSARGRLRLCMPCRTVERLEVPSPAAGSNGGTTRSVAMDTVDLVATLAETEIAAGQLADLRVGDIVATETPAGASVVVALDGVRKFYAKPGVCQERRAVRPTGKIDPTP